MNRGVRQSNTQGFTLIELLIAITILSLLLFTGSYSYRLLSSHWNKELGQFSTTARVAKHLTLTQRLLEGVKSHIVVDGVNIPSFFFIGHQNSLLAVSQSGLFSGSYPEIFRLTAVEKASGLVDLVYQSTSTENILLKGTEQQVNFSQSLVLFSDLDLVKFEYFGWRNFDEKSDDQNNGFKQSWHDNYSGIDSQYMPSKMRITMVLEGNSLSFPITLQTEVESWLSPYFDRDF